MSKTTFLVGEDLWKVLPKLVRSSRRVDAAIAYLGQDGAKLLPLKRGDRLVVDMSIATVKAGGTCPHEVEKLIKRGVKVFTRSNLHAKIVIADKKALVGSANVSRNSRDFLDEAAVLTGDPVTVERAKEFLDRICIEPVLPEYLSECKRAYKLSHVASKRSSTSEHDRRVSLEELWLVNLIHDLIPKKEEELYNRSVNKAQEKLKDYRKTKVDTIRWTGQSKIVKKIKMGDRLIQCIKHKDGRVFVYPPARLILIDHYTVEHKDRYLFHLESPKRGQPMAWSEFRKVLGSLLGRQISRPRHTLVRDPEQADALLRLWTPSGRISRR